MEMQNKIILSKDKYIVNCEKELYIPFELISSKKLTAIQLKVCIAGMNYADNNEIIISQEYFAQKIHISKRTLIKTLKELEEIGLCEKNKRIGSANLYIFTPYNIFERFEPTEMIKIAEELIFSDKLTANELRLYLVIKYFRQTEEYLNPSINNLLKYSNFTSKQTIINLRKSLENKGFLYHTKNTSMYGNTYSEYFMCNEKKLLEENKIEWEKNRIDWEVNKIEWSF